MLERLHTDREDGIYGALRLDARGHVDLTSASQGHVTTDQGAQRSRFDRFG